MMVRQHVVHTNRSDRFQCDSVELKKWSSPLLGHKDWKIKGLKTDYCGNYHIDTCSGALISPAKFQGSIGHDVWSGCLLVWICVVKSLNISTEKLNCEHMWKYLKKYLGIFKTLATDCEGWGVCSGHSNW